MIIRLVTSVRFAEIAITLSTWVIILLPLLLAPFHPAIAAYGIIAFDIYFLYKAFKTAIYATLSYLEIEQTNKIDFPAKKTPLWEHITHLVIIPHYKEPLYKLAYTIEQIQNADYPYKNNITIILGCEAREEKVQEKVQSLQSRYTHTHIYGAYHVLQDHEVVGKASNQTSALKQYLTQHTVDPKNTVVTVCDADSILPKNFFSYLTHTYTHDNNRLTHFYWAPVMLYQNFWQLSFFVRMQSTISSILRLAFLRDAKNLIQISTYACSLQLLLDIDFWDVDVIPEDWHVHLQAFFHHGSCVKTIPLFTIVNGDAVYTPHMIKTMQNRYDQERRWAWGVSDVAYTWNRMWHTSHIPFMIKLEKFLFLLESHLLWPTSFFILTIAANMITLANPLFQRTVMGFILPQISGLILSISTGLILVYVFVDIRIRKSLKNDTTLWYTPILLLQWIFLPYVSFILSTLPALDAHTKMLLGKKLVYKVTEKS